MILEKFAFFFSFNLRKQSVTDFSFSLTQNFVLCLEITTATHCKFFHIIVATVAYQKMVAHQCPSTMLRPLLDI